MKLTGNRFDASTGMRLIDLYLAGVACPFLDHLPYPFRFQSRRAAAEYSLIEGTSSAGAAVVKLGETPSFDCAFLERRIGWLGSDKLA